MERIVEWGEVDPWLADELPGLGLAWTRVDARAVRTPRALRRRLRELADRFTGAKVVQSRQDSVPWAYRVLWRRLGLDPDVDRTPVERLMVERLRRGGLRGRRTPVAAAALATLETGVPVVVLDAAAVEGRPRLRQARPGESIGDDRDAPLRAGEVVYADERRPLARLAGEVAQHCAATSDTTAMVVCALSAAGVPAMAVDEALWIAADALVAAGTLEETRGGHGAAGR